MSKERRALAITILLAGLLSATPAYASDFTGILTMMVTVFGGTFAWTAGTVFLASRRAGNPVIRWWLAVAGLAVGAVLTVWWLIAPIAEGYAFLILIAVPFAALMVANATPAEQPTDPG